MASHTRVENTTNGQFIKRSQARNRVEQCLSVWVVEGFSIRDLNLAERVAARSKQSAEREPVCCAELPGIVYQPSASGTAQYREGISLIRAANEMMVSS